MTNEASNARAAFQAFPAEYALAPLWYWNDDLQEAELVRQLREMKRQHVLEPMVFPMAGLTTPYLSDAYFRLFRFALDEAKKLGMKLWVFDEYCWPSGLAGGIINEQYPEYLMPACRFYRYPVAATDSRDVQHYLPRGRVIAAQAVNRGDGRALDVFDCVDDSAVRWRAPEGAWDVTLAVIHEIQHGLDCTTAARWANNLPGYLDVMNPVAVAKYVELVYEGHCQAAGDHVGSTLPGFFTDEPGIWYDFDFRGSRSELRHVKDMRGLHAESLRYTDEPDLYGLCRTMPWTRDLLVQFRERYGYDLRPRLCELAVESDACRRVAFEFMHLVSDLFAENYCEQIGQWCGDRGIAYTGHYGEGVDGGDHYRQLRPQHVPGIDVLGGIAAAHRLAPLARTAATAARLHDRSRVIVETYGATDWDLELGEKVAVADVLTIMGTNLHAPIDYAYSFRSFRKHTSNPPGFFQSSNWQYQRYFSDRLARLCHATSVGEPAVRTLILFPTDAALSNTLVDAAANQAIERNVTRAFVQMLNWQLEADIVSDTALADLSIANGAMTAGAARYDIVVLPPVDIVSTATLAALVQFARSGGTLLFLYALPIRTPDGQKLDHDWLQPCSPDLLEQSTRPTVHVVGDGRAIFVPDPASSIRLSALPRAGEPLNLFDGIGSLMCMDAAYPHTLSLDLGEACEVTSIALTIEDIKTEIDYAYEVQTSNDGETWHTVLAANKRGKVQRFELDAFGTQHLRLRVTEGGGRFFGLHDLDIRYCDAAGDERRWLPPDDGAAAVSEHLHGETVPLCFGFNERRLADATVLSVVNLSAAERSLAARPQRSDEIELWDLDSGQAAPVTADASGTFPASFAPWEARVFVMTDVAGAPSSTGRLAAPPDRRREVHLELPGPWRFRADRENALPLAATRLAMADPAHPDTWLACEAGGTIPEPLRLVPRLLFRAAFEADALSGDECLLFEEDIESGLAVNGEPVAQPARNRYLDTFGLSVPVAEMLRPGTNVITGIYAPEIYERTTQGSCYHHARLQPTLDAFLLGSIAVIDGRVAAPVAELDSRPWQQQGYAYYSGTGTYTVEFELNELPPLWLEADTRGGVLEVHANGELAGVRVVTPYLIDLTGLLASGPNRLEIRVTNMVGSLLAAQLPGWSNSDITHSSGLQSVRLVKLVGTRDRGQGTRDKGEGRGDQGHGTQDQK
jgi:hypothetical protein